MALHPESCRKRIPFAHNRKNHPPLSCSIDFAIMMTQGLMSSSPFYTELQPPLPISRTCSAAPDGHATNPELYAAVVCTCAAALDWIARYFDLLYSASCCARAAAPGGLANSSYHDILRINIMIRFCVLFLRCRLYHDVRRADTRCSVLCLLCFAWQPC